MSAPQWRPDPRPGKAVSREQATEIFRPLSLPLPDDPPSTRLKVTLAVPVPVNQYWRVFKKGLILSKAARAYKASAFLGIRLGPPIAGPVALRVVWYRALKSGDLDGRLKCLLDVLQGRVYANDSQVVEIHAYRREDKANPRVEVEAWSVAEVAPGA